MSLFIFDMGGVMVGSFDVLPEAALRLGLPETELRRLAAPDLDELMAGRMAADDYWARFSVASGLSVGEDYWSTLFAPSLDPVMVGLARSLRRRGRVVCGTNTIASHYDYLRATGMYDVFDAVYASHLMGVCKPDPDFWRLILEAEGVAAPDAVFVDDMAENAEAAGALGLRAHLFDGVAGLEAFLDRLDDEPEAADRRLEA
ncbi:MAG TPA: HAD family phosphatase [Spirochaetales bacterium]|nr:HAD family phosphatase [Spirochaetales bacterium]